jgi:transcriptional regulator with XRE-family HTH domain
MSASSAADQFPQRLRAARLLRGLGQDDLARKTRLQPSAISHFETGSRRPSFDNLRKLADALEVTTDYLLGRVAHIGEQAEADRLHRHFDKLNADDRDFAEDLLQKLAQRAAAKKKGSE